MKPHKHQSSNYCICSVDSFEPNDNCPIHSGGEWPPRCMHCGQFIKWMNKDKQLELFK